MTRFAFVRLVIFLMAGILLCLHYDSLATVFIYIFAGLAGLYVLLFLLSKNLLRHFRLNLLLALLGFGLSFCLGYLLTFQKTLSHRPDHLLNDTATILAYEGRMTADVQEKTKFVQVPVEIWQVKTALGWQKKTGKVMLNIRRDSLHYYRYGDHVLVKGPPQTMPAPVNPGQFDYRRYLSFQQIYHQQFVKPEQLTVLDNDPPSRIVAFSLQIRRYFDGVLENLVSSEQEYAIATGVVLGVRESLDNDIKQAYASAGAMHVLAVSGMQVALLFQVLTIFLGNLKKLPFGKYLFAAVILSVLWFYCLVTGLSASVLRAIVMFSFIVIAQTFGRNTNMYNTLAVSAFTLLCLNPFLVMDAGFQLSYLAVLGIVAFHNPIYNLLDIDNKILDWCWQITCVSLAAQVLTVPVSLYHFHQFPMYFWLGNLAIIPLSTVVLYLGLITLAVSWIPYLSTLCGLLLKWNIWLLNQVVFLTEKIPGSLLTGIDYNTFEIILLYGITIFTVLLFYTRKFWYGILAVVCLGIISLNTLQQSYTQKSQKQLAVFSINKFPVLDLIDGQQHIFVSDSALLHNEPSWGFNLKNHWYNKGVQVKRAAFVTFEELPKIYPVYQKQSDFGVMTWQGRKILIVFGKIKRLNALLSQIQPDWVILQRNALRNLTYLKGENLSRILFILDASNSPFTAQKLKDQARELALQVHAVAEDGAFIRNE
jgi:competence protein ComEC